MQHGATPCSVMSLDASTKLSVAAEAEADPRSVAKEYSLPGSVRGRTGERIRKVLTVRGLRADTSAASRAREDSAA